MAKQLASIFCIDKDNVNCPFYFEIGACRHGDQCSATYETNHLSHHLAFKYVPETDMVTPGMDIQGHAMDPRKIQEHFEDFSEDLFDELSKYEELESLNICNNLVDHMVGNVYVQFQEEESSYECVAIFARQVLRRLPNHRGFLSCY